MFRLSSLRQAYALGRRHARAQARRELDELACRLHNEVCEIANEMTSRLRDEIVRLTNEVSAARDEFHRLQNRDAEQFRRLQEQLDAATGELIRDRYMRAVEEAEHERTFFDISLH
jgi:hypothetical protein